MQSAFLGFISYKMKFHIALLFCALFAWRIEAKPSAERLELVEDDMFLTKEQKEVYNQLKYGRVRRAAVKDRLWPKGKVYYTFHRNLDKFGKDLATKAMKHWMDKTCLKFIKRTNERAYVTFQYDNRRNLCSSIIGFYNSPNLPITLGRWNSPCQPGTAIHEIGHAIGFFHEHTRPDRNKFLEMKYENMKPGKYLRSQFKVRKDDEIDSRGEKYDFDSIMHYSRFDGSKNRKPVMVPKPPHENVEFGQRKGLSAGDIAQAKLMYKCNAQGDSELDYVPSADDNGKEGSGPVEILQ